MLPVARKPHKSTTVHGALTAAGVPKFSELLKVDENNTGDEHAMLSRFDHFETEKYTPSGNAPSFRAGSKALIRDEVVFSRSVRTGPRCTPSRHAFVASEAIRSIRQN